MKIMNVTINGIAPLLMNSNRGVNPLEPLTIEKKKYTSKRKKTEEDFIKILELSYYLAMYYDEKIGPYIPAINVEATLREAAKQSRRGKDVKMGLRVDPDMIPLQYDGPRKIDELWADRQFQDIRIGKIKQASVTICRPRFNHWKLDFQLSFDESIFDEAGIKDISATAGKYIGLCDYRPRYGLFEVIEIK